MSSSLLNLLVLYGGAALIGIVVGFLFKAYFASQMHSRIRDYQSDIFKSHSKILELEEANYKLETRLKEVEGIFSKDKIFMN